MLAWSKLFWPKNWEYTNLMANALAQFIGQLLLNRPTRRKPLTELVDDLQNDGQTILANCKQLPDTPANRASLAHIIAIECWGQRRLKVGLGASSTIDQSDAYYPAPDLGWPALQALFGQTRQATLTLAQQLGQFDLNQTVHTTTWGRLRSKAG